MARARTQSSKSQSLWMSPRNCVLISFLAVSFTLLFFWGGGGPCCSACGIIVPRPGTEPLLPKVEACSPNHWTTREIPRCFLRPLKSDNFCSKNTESWWAVASRDPSSRFLTRAGRLLPPLAAPAPATARPWRLCSWRRWLASQTVPPAGLSCWQRGNPHIAIPGLRC